MELSSGIECIPSLKFSATQKFQMPTAIDCLKIMLLLFTTYRKVSLQHNLDIEIK